MARMWDRDVNAGFWCRDLKERNHWEI